ncbi:hypothetical protein RirG_157450 [Rhizophagus irregularis DAOM 197198w]|uniref:MULE transposase domain-containing protein n=2 Tax=Rhizophagus irregularis TaxID=588596 RepID=A0A015J031_RHIIW|nr:hypothetical protein RirG_157450 [Rhizophagus irregularis DAOM 197198w]
MICRFKANIQIKNDAAALVEYLVKLHAENPEWYFKVDFESIDNRLSKIFWMSPEQKKMWYRYHDVVINDNTCKTNKYSMPLSVFIIIDSDQRSRIVATAIVCDETVSTYEWILEQTKNATGDLQPATIFTDADPAMQNAIHKQYPKSFIRHCSFHIRQNLIKKVKKKLCNKWDTFLGDFYALRNSIVMSDFEHRWTDLINHYPEVQEYCERVSYPTKTCWAYAFTKRSFSANTHSTQRVERNSLCQLHSGIELRLKDEAKYARWQEFRNMNPTTGMPRVSDTIFRNVDEICKKYLTPNSLALQRKQMVESLLYRTWIKEVENIYLLDSNRYDEGFVEDDYEEPQILINMALEACSNGIVNEIWEVRHLQSTKNRSQFVIILDDGSHYCTCLYLIYAGFVCRYFFAVMLQSKIAQFNIKLIPSRWYSKEGLSVMDKIQENSIQLIQDGEQRTGTFYTLNIIRGQEVYNEFIKNLDSKKEIFGRGIGLCKKALNLAIASNSHQVFENLLQQFIEQQTVSLSAQDDDLTEEVLGISNPIQHKGKGRPANKRYLSAIENCSNRNANSKNQDQDEVSEGSRKKNKRQCALCKSWYHDSRNCPSKNKEQDKENI